MIPGRRIVTNAHVVADHTFVLVRKHGSPTKYKAEVQAIGHECDLALLSVESEDFWEGMHFLELGDIPFLQEAVAVVGYPQGTWLNSQSNINLSIHCLVELFIHQFGFYCYGLSMHPYGNFITKVFLISNSPIPSSIFCCGPFARGCDHGYPQSMFFQIRVPYQLVWHALGELYWLYLLYVKFKGKKMLI